MIKISNTPDYNYNVSHKSNNSSTLPNNLINNVSYTNEYMASDTSAATRAYGLSIVNKNKTIPQKSLKDMIVWLESQGKTEGVDFDFDSSFTNGNTILIIKNKLGQEELIVHYDGRDYSAWSGYEVYEYKNGNKSKVVSRDYNGNINNVTKIYKNDDISIQHLFENGLNYDVTPEDYIRQLKENNIKYDIEYTGENENNRSVHIDVFDDNGNINYGLWFYYGDSKFDEHCKWVSRSEFNEEQKEHRRIIFDKNDVEIVTYVNYQ